MSRRPRVAVVGHVEWVTHVRGVLPAPGRITYHPDTRDEPAGGGGVAAVQVARLGADCLFLTAVGDDDTGRRVVACLEAEGMEVRAAVRPQPHTRALSAVDAAGDRAIAVLGATIHPEAGDDLGWADLAACDAVYFTGRDPATLPLARSARTLVVTARRWRVLAAAQDVRPDVVVGSADDPDERIDRALLPDPAACEVWTQGARGGRWRVAGNGGGWHAAPPPGPVVDTYGCGDAFAAGLTVGLARGLRLAGAVRLGARCGAAVATGYGGLAAQLVEPAP